MGGGDRGGGGGGKRGFLSDLLHGLMGRVRMDLHLMKNEIQLNENRISAPCPVPVHASYLPVVQWQKSHGPYVHNEAINECC